MKLEIDGIKCLVKEMTIIKVIDDNGNLINEYQISNKGNGIISKVS